MNVTTIDIELWWICSLWTRAGSGMCVPCVTHCLIETLWLGFQVAFAGGHSKARDKLKSLAWEMSLTQTWSQSLTNELTAIHHLKRFCYSACVFTSWSAEKENGRLFCAAKVCVSESPAQVGAHSLPDVEHFTRISKMSNNVKLSPQTTIRWGEKQMEQGWIMRYTGRFWRVQSNTIHLLST